jgi:hypothetical protein
MSFRNRRARSAPILVLTLVSLVLATLGILGPATAADDTATQINITDITTPGIEVPQTDGAPDLFLVVGVGFNVKVTFTASDGTTLLPISTTKDATLRVTTTTGLDAGKTLGSVVVPKGATSATITGAKLITSDNNLKLSVSGFIKSKPVDGLQPGESGVFDAQKSFFSAPAATTKVSIGPGGGAGATCTPTPQQPTCAELYLPSGAGSNQLLSLGSCNGLENACDPKESVVQALFKNPDQNPYTRTSPILMILKCDKTLCGGGAVYKVDVMVALLPTDPGEVAQPCPANGTIGALQQFCVDNVMSKRDNSGDTYRFLWFLHDLRAWHG